MNKMFNVNLKNGGKDTFSAILSYYTGVIICYITKMTYEWLEHTNRIESFLKCRNELKKELGPISAIWGYEAEIISYIVMTMRLVDEVRKST